MGATRSNRLKKYQRVSVALLVAMGIINYFDRSTISIANKLISDDLALSATEMGLIFSVFSWAYAVAQLPTGALLDKKGAKLTLGIGLVAWSIIQAVSGLASSMWQMFTARIALGVGEAPQYIGGVKAVSDWFIVKDRGFPTGIFLSSTTVGSMLAPPVLTVLMVSFGWRAMFIVMGAVGLILSLLWFLYYRDRHNVQLTGPESEYFACDQYAHVEEQAITFSSWLGLFRQKTTWGMALGFVGVMYMVILTLAWLPGYLEHEHHLSIVTTGWVLVIPYLFATIGMFSSGYLADKLVSAKVAPIMSRKIPLCLGLVGCAVFSIFTVSTSNVVASVSFLCAAMFFVNLAGGSAWGLVGVAAPSNLVASLGSIQNFMGFFGGAFAPFITGWIVDRSGSFSNAFYVAAAIACLSAAAYAVLVQEHVKSNSD